MLRSFAKDCDKDAAFAVTEVLKERGHHVAAADLAWGIAHGCKFRDRLGKRILSELGGTVFQSGSWPRERRYVAILRKEGAVLWERLNVNGWWYIWGTYLLSSYHGDAKEMMRVLRTDIRYESLSKEKRMDIWKRREPLEDPEWIEEPEP